MLLVSSQLARGLRQLGVNRSDRVAMLLPNCFELVALWFATSSLGAIEVPTNPGLKGDLLCHNLNNCGAEVLVADASALAELAKVQGSLPSLRTLILVGTDPAEARAAGIRIGRIVSFEECLASATGLRPCRCPLLRPDGDPVHFGHHGAGQGCTDVSPSLLLLGGRDGIEPRLHQQ
jgi:crotonobetaine/carnitine-CoA ligase